MVDKPWEEGAIKVIRKTGAVVPIYFHAKVVYFTCYLKLVALFALQKTAFRGFSQNIGHKVRIENQSQ
jgi:hypothetical protein